ncbi:NADPH-dependent FMN reductase [uncultured delta proteobacterium]|uniref:NADPH-dependent FMN reductase n=1 Tax=uncultured delta proteobacterium TaxID=34034 RepID=A0A212J333_9DELT|nr:NADPH-dependent FMN reductase [uncultured delta proteobacterium]
MKKHVLIVTGSPRRGGNSDLLADAFAKGALGAGHDVMRFSSAKDKVTGCIACDTCWSKGKPCSFDDGFDTLAPMLEQADTLVLCGPLYWFSFSAQLKAAIDKLYAYMKPQCPRKLTITESALLMCAEDTDMNAFNGPVATYNSILGYLGWQDRGMLLVPGVNAKGDILKTDALALAEKMGSEM